MGSQEFCVMGTGFSKPLLGLVLEIAIYKLYDPQIWLEI
jgi:hypothetical protein